MYLVFYDISIDRIRTKIAGRLIAEGYERLQLSVFVGTSHPKSNQTLWKELNTWLKKDQKANLCVLRISTQNFKKMQIIGNLDYDINYLLGTEYSIFI